MLTLGQRQPGQRAVLVHEVGQEITDDDDELPFGQATLQALTKTDPVPACRLGRILGLCPFGQGGEMLHQGRATGARVVGGALRQCGRMQRYRHALSQGGSTQQVRDGECLGDLELLPRAELHAGTGVNNEMALTLRRFPEYPYHRFLRSCRDAPVDEACRFAWLIGAQLLEIQSLTQSPCELIPGKEGCGGPAFFDQPRDLCTQLPGLRNSLGTGCQTR